MEPYETIQLVQITQESWSHFSALFPSDYQEMRFGRDQTAIGIVYRGIACGAALFGRGEEEMQIYWLYISPKFRRKYLGSLLIGEGIAASQAAGLSLTAELPMEGDGKALRAFLQNRGFSFAESGQSFSLTLGQLRKSPYLARAGGHAASLSSLYPIAWRLFLKKLEQEGNALIGEEDFPGLDQKRSSVVIIGSEVRSCLLVCQEEKAHWSVPFLYLDSSAAATDFLALLKATMMQSEGLPDSVEITAECVNPLAEKLLKRLVPDGKETIFYRAILSPASEGKEEQ